MTYVHPRAAALLTIAALLLLLLPGCLEMEQDIQLEKSGKGTATLKVVIDQVKVKQMQETLGGMMGGGGPGGGGELPNPAEDMSPDKAKELLKGNKKVRLVEATSEVDEETQKITNTYKVEFDSLNDLWEAGLTQGSDVKLEKLENGNYRFTSKFGGDKVPQDEASAEQAKMMMMPMLEPFMKDFKETVVLQLPTAILETNGTKIGDKKVTFTLDFQSLFDPKKLTQVVVFSGEGLDWKPFTITAEDMVKNREESLKPEAAPAAPVTPSEPTPPVPAR